MPWTWPPDTRDASRKTVPELLWALKLGGPVRSPEGKAAATLRDRMELMGARNVPPDDKWGRQRMSNLLQELAGEGVARGRFGKVIQREMKNSKRTLLVRLAPEFTSPDDLPPNPYPYNCWPPPRKAPAVDPLDAVRAASRNGSVVATETVPRPAPSPGPGEWKRQDPSSQVATGTNSTPGPVAQGPGACDARQDPSSPAVSPAVEPDSEPVPEPAPMSVPPGRSVDLFLEREGQPSPVDALLLIQRLSNGVILDLAEMAGQMAARGSAPERPDAAEPESEKDARIDQLLEKNGALVEQNQRLLRKLADATETAVAKKREVEAVRLAMARTQANLDALIKGSQVNDSGFRALNGLMTERPRVAPS